MALGFKTDEICRILTIEAEPVLRFQALAGVQETVQPLDWMAVQQGAKSPPAAPRPERVQQIARTDGTAAAVRTIDNIAYRFQLSEHMTIAAAAQQLAGLTFPDLGARAQAGPIRDPLIATVVLCQEEIVGMALAEEDPVQGSAEILSPYLAPEHRGRRLSYGLLKHLENALRERGCTSVWLTYHVNWPSLPVLERLLGRLGWIMEPPDAPTGPRTARKELPV